MNVWDGKGEEGRKQQFSAKAAVVVDLSPGQKGVRVSCSLTVQPKARLHDTKIKKNVHYKLEMLQTCQAYLLPSIE